MSFMSTTQEDEVFKKILSDLKPYAKALPKNTDVRHTVTKWIKKLLTSSEQKSLRNSYASLLLHMLKEGNVVGVFNETPTSGPLKPLFASKSVQHSTSQRGSYLLKPGWSKNSSLHEDPQQVKYDDDISEHEPQEVVPGTSSELLLEDLSGHFDQIQPKPDYSYQPETSSIVSRRVKFDSSSSLEDFNNDLEPQLIQSDGSDSDVAELLQGSRQVKPAKDQDLLDLLKSSVGSEVKRPWKGDQRNTFDMSGQVTPGYGGKGPLSSQGSHKWFSPYKKSATQSSKLQSKEFEVQARLAESRVYDERVKMQQTLEQTVRKLLDKKNNELEDLKSSHQIQLHKTHSKVQSLERKVQHLQGECAHLKHERERLDNDHKLAMQQLKFDIQTEQQDTIQEVKERFEFEKCDLQQKNEIQLQHNNEEYARRMGKLEQDYKAQLKTSNELIRELEGRISDLTQEQETAATAYSKLVQEKAILEETVGTLEEELITARNKSAHIEKMTEKCERDRREQLEQHQRRAEDTINQLKIQFSRQEEQWSNQLADREKKLTNCRRAKEELEKRYKRELAEAETNHRKIFQEEKRKHLQKIQSLKNEMESQGASATAQQRKLETTIRECSNQMEDLKKVQELQVKQAEKALEEYKTHSEASTSKMFTQMKREMEILENELANSRLQKEKKTADFIKQIEKEKRKHEREVEVSEAKMKNEISYLKQEHSLEVDKLKKDLKFEKEEAIARMTKETEVRERQWKDKVTSYGEMVESLEEEVQSLSAQIHEMKATSQKESADASVRWEEERLMLLKQQEIMVSKLKSQYENENEQAKLDHTKQMETLRKTAQDQARHLELEYSGRVAQTSEAVINLQRQVTELEDELQKQQRLHKEQIKDYELQHENELNSLKTHHLAMDKVVEQESKDLKSKVNQLESQLKECELKNSEKLSRLKLQYENRMKGLVPQSVQRDYESTIRSLRDQIQVSNQRSSLLQQELNHLTEPKFTSSYSATPSKSRPF